MNAAAGPSDAFVGGDRARIPREVEGRNYTVDNLFAEHPSDIYPDGLAGTLSPEQV